MNRKKDFIVNFVALLLIIFLVLFPKGGFKVSSIPITWGYLLLIIFTLIGVFKLFINRFKDLTKRRITALLLILPFQIMSILCLIFNGWIQMGFTISFVISIIFIPFVFVVVFGSYLDKVDLSFIFTTLRHIIFIIAVYGILLFIYRMFVGSFFEIPYLTVNFDDLGTLDEKHIDRGGVFKLISTYNNGNIYGNCVLMLLPLYSLLEKNKFKTILVKISLFLTLARTVWIGLFLYEVMSRLLFNFNQNSFLSSKELAMEKFKSLFKFIFTLVILYIGITLSLSLFNQNIDFIFDSKLGGRSEQLDVLKNFNFIPSKSFDAIAEIVYVSILDQFGFLGLLLFILQMIAPLLANTKRFSLFLGSYYKQACAFGIILYLIIAGSDGALLYIPVMPIYWFLASLYLCSFRSN